MPGRLLCTCSIVFSVGCSSPDVLVQLTPDLVSSLDGTMRVRVIALADRDPSPDEQVDVTIEYTDRSGAAHAVAPVAGATDGAGVFETTLTGLTWDGRGTVTAAISQSVEASATFAVLDRTPPTLLTSPPPPASVRRGNTVTVRVRVTDETGVSQVRFDSSDTGSRDRSIIASGATDTTVDFDYDVPDVAPGSMFVLYALAADMSGNEGAAPPVTITVVP